MSWKEAPGAIAFCEGLLRIAVVNTHRVDAALSTYIIKIWSLHDLFLSLVSALATVIIYSPRTVSCGHQWP
jgi:hypothetical protein